MQNVTNEYIQAIDAPVRKLSAKVELYNGSTLAATYTSTDILKSIDIERVGEDSKFFGFGVSSKYNIKLIDRYRELNITTAHSFKIYLGIISHEKSFATAYVTEVHRDENTGELSITAYDILDKTKSLTFAEVEITAPYTIKDVAEAIGAKIGATEAITGKNLWDNNNYSTGIPDEYIQKTETGFIFTRGNLTGGRHVSPDLISVKAGETYTFSCDAESTGTASIQLFVYKDKPYGDVLKNVNGNTITYTFEEDMIVSFTIILNSQLLTLNVSNIQLEKNTKRTNFEPYISAFDTEYTEGANFEGTETLEEALRAIAEATQTIYFINSEDALIFKRLDKEGAAVKLIDKEQYITLDSKTNRRLATVCHATELGDNVSASITEAGTTQYVRDNPFWEMREDIADIVDAALEAIGGLTINQFECEWRGDFALEPGDKIELVTKDDNSVTSYILNDTISYNGALTEKTAWQYTDSEETESNPSNLGEVIKQTYARVDKANKQINLVVSEVNANSNALSTLQVNLDGVTTSVQKIEQTTNEALESVNNDINTLTKTVETKATAEDVTIAIKSELENGVSKVETETGFKFDKDGLTVSKAGSEMTTTIDEDGMTIKRDGEEQLVANNEGVMAYDLHAKTYLIVGESSRFEDYEKDGETRTGCFWIGETGV